MSKDINNTETKEYKKDNNKKEVKYDLESINRSYKGYNNPEAYLDDCDYSGCGFCSGKDD